MRIYVDSNSMYTVGSSSLNTTLALPSGSHNVTIVAWDSTGKAYTKSLSVNVGGTTTVGGVAISSPANGATLSSPVQFMASARANSGRTIVAMRIYVDGVSAYLANAASLNTSLSLPSGPHYVVVQAWDNTGAVYKAAENITVASTAPVVSHSVSLKWGASSSSGIVAYNVYRSTPGGTYTKIASTAGNVTNYTDSQVTAGATYYYVTTALNSAGAESKYSNSATAIIPTP
jgi:WD40 repeat protein